MYFTVFLNKDDDDDDDDETKCTSISRNQILKYRDAMTITGITLENSWHISFRQSRPKVVGTLKLYLVVSPSPPPPPPHTHLPPGQCWKMSHFFPTKREKSHLIINIESGGRRELASCPNSFVWDCTVGVAMHNDHYKPRHLNILDIRLLT